MRLLLMQLRGVVKQNKTKRKKEKRDREEAEEKARIRRA